MKNCRTSRRISLEEVASNLELHVTATFGHECEAYIQEKQQIKLTLECRDE
jgi:hypothetical protein